jgi:hypothetical protein
LVTPFLHAFAFGLVTRLIEAEELLIHEGKLKYVVAWLATDLAKARQGRSLISTVSMSLISCEDVEDLFADNDAIGAHIVDMGAAGG